MNLRIIVCSILIISFQIANAQQFNDNSLQNFTNSSSLKGATVAIKAIDVANNKEITQYNSNSLLAPASIQKIVTTAAALEMLGPDFRFQTNMGFNGNINHASQNLNGDLVIKGGGDPTLGSSLFANGLVDVEFWQTWINTLQKAGVKTISGNLVVDRSVYGGATIPGTWPWDDIGNYYGAGPSACTVFDNRINLFFDSPERPGEPVILVKTMPESSGIEWEIEVVSSDINRDMAFVYGAPWGGKRVVRGTIPAGRKNFEVKAALPDPALFLGNFFKEKLEMNGIKLSGNVLINSQPATFETLYTTWSPPLSEIIKVLNYESVNLLAEHLVMQIAVNRTGKGTYAAGLQIITNFWKEKNISETMFLEDGSGLSRFNALSANQMVQILSYIPKSATGQVFINSLPSAGHGTLTSFKTTDFQGKTLQCKSGSMTRVRAYAGYLKCNSGRTIAFTIIVNNFTGTHAAVFKEMEKLILSWKTNW